MVGFASSAQLEKFLKAGENTAFPRKPYQDVDEGLYKRVEREFQVMGLLSEFFEIINIDYKDIVY